MHGMRSVPAAAETTKGVEVSSVYYTDEWQTRWGPTQGLRSNFCLEVTGLRPLAMHKWMWMN